MAIIHLGANRILGSSTAGVSSDSLGSTGDPTNNGATLDTSTTVPSGLGTGCLNFDGSNDYLDCSSLMPQVAMTTTGTISFWFRPDAVSGDYLWSIGDTNGTDGRIYFEQQASNKWVVTCNHGNTPLWKVDSTVGAFSTNTWYHIVVTHDGGNSYGAVKLYINGVDRTTNSNNGSTWDRWMFHTGIDNMWFGGHSHNNNAGYGKADGKFKDIAIWNTALPFGTNSSTAGSVKWLYNDGDGRTADTISSGLRAYYKCDSATVVNWRGNDEKVTLQKAGVDGTWSAGGNLGSDVTECASGGNSNNAIIMGGYAGSNSGITTTQEYDGSSWTGGGNLQSGGGSTCGGGNSSDAIIMTGKSSGANLSGFCQEYNGTAWSDGGNPNTNRHNCAGDGNSSDAICVGGSPSQSETYDGSSWTDIAEVTGRENFAMGGNSTSAICFGATVKTETWDGTSWTTVDDMTQANGGNEGGGLPTDAITIGGTTDSDMVEKYNGTAWSVVDLLTTGRGNHGGKGNNLNSFCAGGGSVTTEERTSTADNYVLEENTIFIEKDTSKIYSLGSGVWNVWYPVAWSTALTNSLLAGGTTNAWTAGNFAMKYTGTWANITALPASRQLLVTGGNNDDAIVIGGDSAGTSNTEDDVYGWNGSTWSTLPLISMGNMMFAGGGNQTGAIWYGGTYSAVDDCQTYNGTAWATANDLNHGTRGNIGAGTNEEAYSAGGYDGSESYETWNQRFNGTTWSDGVVTPTSKFYGYGGGSGKPDIAICTPNEGSTGGCYTFNGTSWATTGNTNYDRKYRMVGGSSDNATKSGGSDNGDSNTSETFDGSTWSTTGNITTDMYGGDVGGNV